jgi:hypothetical protein
MAVYSAFLGLYAVGWYLLPYAATRLGIASTAGGNALHLWSRLRQVGACNILETVRFYLGHHSPLLVGFVALTVPLALVGGLDQKASLLMLYWAPHLLVWLFLFKPLAGHTVYEFPALALLSASGVVKLWRGMQPSFISGRAALVGTLVAVLGLSAWHNYVLFCQDRLTATWEHGVAYSKEWFRQVYGVPLFVHRGQAAAGVYIRRHSDYQDGLVTDFGGSLQHYYAGHAWSPHAGALATTECTTCLDIPCPPAPHVYLLSDSTAMKERGLRFLVLAYDEVFPCELTRKLTLAATVTVRGRPTLRVYDLWGETDRAETVVAEEHAPIFYAEYAHWERIMPLIGERSIER